MGVCTLLILFGQLWGTSNSSSVYKKGNKEEIESKRGHSVPLLCLLSADGSRHSALVFEICCVLAHPLQECTRPTANDRLEPLWCTQAVGAKAAASQPPGCLASSCTQRYWLMARNMSAKRASVYGTRRLRVNGEWLSNMVHTDRWCSELLFWSKYERFFFFLAVLRKKGGVCFLRRIYVNSFTFLISRQWQNTVTSRAKPPRNRFFLTCKTLLAEIS